MVDSTLLCNKELWIEGLWYLLIGSTLVASSAFGLLKGNKIYIFSGEKEA